MKAKSINGDSVAVNARLSAEVYAALQEIMAELRLTKTQAIEQAIIDLAEWRKFKLTHKEPTNELHG